MQVPLPLIKGDRKSKLDYRDNLPVNMTAVIREIEGDNGYLLTHDGLTEFAQTSGVARGGVFNERFNEHYRVSGNAFEQIDSSGAVSVLGVVSGSDLCSFANSFNTQAILSDGKYYLWDNATLTQVLDPELGVPIDITWFRGIYVMTDGESLFHTDINNESSISPLKYSSSEFASDPIVGVARNDQNQILAFNRYSTEYFFFNAAAPSGTSVLQVISGKGVKVGIVGTHCKTELDGVFFILGGRKEESPSIRPLIGSRDDSISTREIDKLIGKYTESQLSDVVLESRVVDRDKFLICHLPDETLLFNLTISQKIGKQAAWTIIKTGVQTDEPWRGKFGVFDPRAAKWIYGDIKESKLGYLNQEVASQYNEQVENICYSPIIAGHETLSVNNFEINTIAGYSSSDMTCFNAYSSDGVTWQQERSTLISEQGDYNRRYIVRDTFYIREDFSMRFRFVSSDKMSFSGLKADIT